MAPPPPPPPPNPTPPNPLRPFFSSPPPSPPPPPPPKPPPPGPPPPAPPPVADPDERPSAFLGPPPQHPRLAHLLKGRLPLVLLAPQQHRRPAPQKRVLQVVIGPEVKLRLAPPRALARAVDRRPPRQVIRQLARPPVDGRDVERLPPR